MSSDWLDRLWSSKGFSSTTHLDPDPFTASPRHSHSNISTNNQTVHPIRPPPMAMDAQQTSNNNQPSNAFTRITNALSDLYCVGDPIPKSSSSSSFPGARKFPRKQPNPMHYVGSKSSDSDINTDSPGGDQIGTRKNVSVSPMMSVGVDNINNGLGLLKDDQVKLVENFYCTEEEEDADKGCPSLDGFSRTEVTVIDTSFAGWKFEKFLFRKNVTWKVRDKKGNKATMALGKKKRKKKKKRKALVMAKEKNEGKKLKVLHQGSIMLKTGSSGCNEEHLSGDKLQASCTKASDAVDIVSKKEQSTTANLLEGSSSIVRIRSVPTGKKSGTSFLRSCVDPSQKQTND